MYASGYLFLFICYIFLLCQELKAGFATYVVSCLDQVSGTNATQRYVIAIDPN